MEFTIQSRKVPTYRNISEERQHSKHFWNMTQPYIICMRTYIESNNHTLDNNLTDISETFFLI